MDTSVVFVTNIPLYVYYNCPRISSVSPSYRSLIINENSEGISLICYDAEGVAVMPYPEYVLALFTFLFEVLGRYKRHLKIQCADGTHNYSFYVDSAHNYGVKVDICKQILTYNLNLPDCDGLSVTDYQGYDLIRLLYVKNLDCFSPTVLKGLRFLSTSANCTMAVAYSYMRALRLLCEPSSDLLAEALIAIVLSISKMKIKDFDGTLCYYPARVLLDEGAPVYFTSCTVGNPLDRASKMC